MRLFKRRGARKKVEAKAARTMEGTVAMSADGDPLAQKPELYSTEGATGMKVVAEPTDAALDIVFVHGITGNRETTWTHEEGVFWPELLAQDIKTARIMTFGYDADVVKIWGMAGSNNLRDHGKSLAFEVSDRRRGCRERPVIFIAHSLGGLVCEQALLYCGEGEENLEKVFRSTRGIIFMGTPHAGADLANLGHNLAQCLNKARKTNSAILEPLRRESGELTAVGEKFQTLLLKPGVNIKIYCFFEEKAVLGVGLIVRKDSAALRQYYSQSIAANHMDMTKFSGTKDAGYQKVLNRLQDNIEAMESANISPKDPTTHPEYEKRRRCHQNFRTSKYELHKERNPDPVEGTCQWFLQHQNYTSWRDSHNSKLLWVSADPGCGKSVLSRLLADKELQTTKSRSTCYFFFKDDDEEQKTATNALCALLHQVFRQNFALLEHAVEIVDMNEGQNVKNSVDLLWEILTAAARDPQAGEIVCILDALDECRQSELKPLLRKICSFYDKQSHISNTMALKFLLTSRPLQHIEDEFNDLSQKIPEIRLAGEEDTDQIRREIEVVINYEINKIQQKWDIGQNTVRRLREEFSKVEHRTYLWLMLIFDLIRPDLQSVTKKGRERLFGAIPKSIDDAYTAILNQSTDKDQARKLLQIVCFATRPLSVMEIITALSIEEDHETYADLELQTVGFSTTYIRNLCGLFVSVIDGRVFLLHQTAKEFLLAQEDCNKSAFSFASEGIWKNSVSIPDSSSVLALSCMRLLQLKDASSLSLNKKAFYELNSLSLKEEQIDFDELVFSYDFLEYSAKNWDFHFRTALIPDGHPLINLGFELCNIKSDRYMHWRRSDIARNGRRYSLNGFNNLLWASYLGLEKVVRLVLDTPGIDVNAADKRSGRTPLWVAASEGREAVVGQLLAAPGIDVNAATKNSGWTPLWAAASGGHEAVVGQLLAAPGIDVNAATKNSGWTPLWAAASRGREAVVGQLLAAPGIDVNAADKNSGQTPLSVARERGHEGIIKLLENSSTSSR